ncbi:MAG: fibronectin type [Paenibacillaceae bacterium]|jgi:O-glycosyl hydrolase|nr:fibronectin type [Paenibacillaceae bacterium]
MTQPIIFTADPSTTFQTIEHFGASDAWSADPIGKHWSEVNKNKLADLLFSQDSGIGLSAWRFNIGGGMGLMEQITSATAPAAPGADPWRRAIDCFKPAAAAPYDWSRHAGQQWFLRAAQARGVEQFIAFVNSPPYWMTKNGFSYASEDVGTSNLAPGAVDSFVGFLMDVLAHFHDNGIDFHHISPINEPSWDWNNGSQEGNRYSNEDIRRVVAVLADRLRERRLPTRISVAEAAEIGAMLDDSSYRQLTENPAAAYSGHNNETKYGGKYREYIREFLADPSFADRIDHHLAYHSYFYDRPTETEDRLVHARELLRNNAASTGRTPARLWQTEYCLLGKDGRGRDLGMDSALRVAQVIHCDLAYANASAWSWWLAISRNDYKDGLIYTDYTNPGDEETIWPSKILWILGHYSRFIRPGAVRCQMSATYTTQQSDILASAYIAPNGADLIYVFINMSNEAHELRIQSKGSTLTPYLTSPAADDNLRPLPLIPTDAAFTLPARSVLTLVERKVSLNPLVSRVIA